MDSAVAIALVGLVGALLAALYVIRRRDDELDRLLTAAQAPARRGGPARAGGGGPAPDPVPEPVAARRTGSRTSCRSASCGSTSGRTSRRRTPAHTCCWGSVPGGWWAAPSWRRSSTPAWRTLLTGVAARRGRHDGDPDGRRGAACRPACVPTARRMTGSSCSSRTSPSCAGSSRSAASSSTTSATSCGRPLSTVSLLAETLARDAERADVPPRMKERIAKVEVETGHLVQMVAELLDLARIEGGSQLQFEDDVDLGRLAESSAERLRLFAERQGVTLVVDVEPGDAARARRRGAARPGVRQPRAQRREVQPRRRGGPDRGSPRRRGGGRLGRGPRDRHREGGPHARVRALLQGGPRARPGRRHRPRACRSPATSSRRTGAASGSTRRRAGDRRSPSPSRSPARPRRPIRRPPQPSRPSPDRRPPRWTACSSRRSTSSTSPIAGRSACRCSSPTWPRSSPTSSGSRRSSTRCSRTGSSGRRGGALRGRPRLGGPPGVRQQPARPGAPRPGRVRPARPRRDAGRPPGARRAAGRRPAGVRGHAPPPPAGRRRDPGRAGGAAHPVAGRIARSRRADRGGRLQRPARRGRASPGCARQASGPPTPRRTARTLR